MSILADNEIHTLCALSDPMDIDFLLGDTHKKGSFTVGWRGPMIEPYIGEQVSYNEKGDKIPSYGLSSAGYDIRLTNKFQLFTRPNDGRVIDVLNYKKDYLSEEIEGDSVVIPPGGFLLSHSVEYFQMPRRVVATCLGKSTWARVGVIINVTPLEPGWSGHLVVEITNGTNLPQTIYSNVGIAQLMFHLMHSEPSTTYEDRDGKYQGQQGITSTKL